MSDELRLSSIRNEILSFSRQPSRISLEGIEELADSSVTIKREIQTPTDQHVLEVHYPEPALKLRQVVSSASWLLLDMHRYFKKYDPNFNNFEYYAERSHIPPNATPQNGEIAAGFTVQSEETEGMYVKTLMAALNHNVRAALILKNEYESKVNNAEIQVFYAPDIIFRAVNNLLVSEIDTMSRKGFVTKLLEPGISIRFQSPRTDPSHLVENKAINFFTDPYINPSLTTEARVLDWMDQKYQIRKRA